MATSGDMYPKFRLQFCLYLSVFCLTLASVHAEFLVIHAPKHVHFMDGAGAISASEVEKAVGLAMGILQQKDMSWTGLAEGNPFKRPRANVLIAVESPLKLSPAHMLSYPLNNDKPVVDLDLLSASLQNLFLNKEPLIVDLASDNTMFDLKSRHESLFRSLPSTVEQALDGIRRSSILQSLGPGLLNITQADHQMLLAEIHVIFQVIENMRNNNQMVKDGVPDLYSFGMSGLAHIVDIYGPGSQQAKDAVKLVEAAINEISVAFRQLYDGNVLVELVRLAPTDRLLVRKARGLLQTVTPTSAPSGGTDAEKYNLAPVYSDMYPVVFNIILWFMVVFGLTVFAVSLGLWNMDPGRDSIIYRMTSTRIKKE